MMSKRNILRLLCPVATIVALPLAFWLGARWNERRTVTLSCTGENDREAEVSVVIRGDSAEVVTASTFALPGSVTGTPGTWTIRVTSLGTYTVNKVSGRMVWNSIEGGADGYEHVYKCTVRGVP
jgi:hypothetical protein